MTAMRACTTRPCARLYITIFTKTTLPKPGDGGVVVSRGDGEGLCSEAHAMTPAALYSPSRRREDPVHLGGSGFDACGVLVVYCARKRNEGTTAPHLVRARAPPR
jgi:hypothetical protein